MRLLILALALLLPGIANAQTAIVKYVDAGGAVVTVSPTNPLPTSSAAGGATAANQTATQANAGSDATKAVAVQGVTGGKAIPISAASLPLPSGAATATGVATVNTTLGSPFQAGGSIGNTAFGATQSGTWTVDTQPAGHSLCHISTATTTTCKSAAGVLHTLSVNNLGTVASLTVVYDNTAGSGTVIASINTLAGQTSYLYDIAFATGLTIVTTGTVAPDITVSYR